MVKGFKDFLKKEAASYLKDVKPFIDEFELNNEGWDSPYTAEINSALRKHFPSLWTHINMYVITPKLEGGYVEYKTDGIIYVVWEPAEGARNQTSYQLEIDPKHNKWELAVYDDAINVVAKGHIH